MRPWALGAAAPHWAAPAGRFPSGSSFEHGEAEPAREHLPLSDCAYVKYNDILAGGEDRGREEFVYIRVQIVEPEGEEVPPDRILFL